MVFLVTLVVAAAPTLSPVELANELELQTPSSRLPEQ
jgi:hypothetical protein